MTISSDFLRGSIDTIVLACLLNGRKYGNEIRREIEAKTDSLYVPNEQSLYSAYHRLEDMGCIKGSWGAETAGATRKYYEITQEGRRFYLANIASWENAKKLIDILIKE
ncbi:MAG: PadR family transcriptional regulator [Clostridia bacterium]|nr:PadR family transcriptional regulator [Clostridia bacterium]